MIEMRGCWFGYMHKYVYDVDILYTSYVLVASEMYDVGG